MTAALRHPPIAGGVVRAPLSLSNYESRCGWSTRFGAMRRIESSNAAFNCWGVVVERQRAWATAPAATPDPQRQPGLPHVACGRAYGRTLSGPPRAG
jgi:hypothetical protein